MEQCDAWFVYCRQGLSEKNAHFIKLLKEKAKKYNVKIEIIEIGKIIISTENGGTLYYKRKLINNYPRLAFNRARSGVELMRFLESKGVKTINNSEVMLTANNKFKTHGILVSNGIKTPKTIFTPSKKITYKTLKNILGEVFIAKDNNGAQGNGVFMIKNETDFQKLPPIKKYIYQEYIKSSFGKDLRIYVLGGKVLGGVMRSAANPEEFRANLSQGGTALPIEITKEIKEIALKIYNIFGFEYLGLDLLFDTNGYTVCEVNANPSMHSMRVIKGLSITDEFYQYILKHKEN